MSDNDSREHSGDRIDKLTENNYHEWAVFMEALLIKREVWPVVEGTLLAPTNLNTVAGRAFVRAQHTAYAEIVLHITPSQLGHINTRDPKVIWDTFAHLHTQRGLSSRLALRRNLITLRKSDAQSMTSWIADVRRAAFALARIGSPVPDDDIILVLTTGLPASYSNLVTTLDAVDPRILTLDYTITRLLSEETRQRLDTTAAPASTSTSTPVNSDPNPTSYAASPTRKKTPIEKITCFKCGKKGHYQSACNKSDSANTAADTAASAVIPFDDIPEDAW